MIFEQGAFTSQAGSSPSEIERKRAAINAMLSQYGRAKYTGEGVADLFTGIANGFAANKLNKEERAGRQKADDLFNGIMGGAPAANYGQQGSQGALAGAMQGQGSPFAPRAPQQAPTGGNAAEIRAGLIERGMPEHIADGFIMNFKDESGLNPGINEANPTVPGSRGGFGLAQWTGPRRKALEAYAAQRGAPVSDTNVQLDFLMQELQGPESRAAQSIMGTQDAGSAAAAVARDFLRPAQQHLDRRVAQYTGGQGMQPTQAQYSGPDMQTFAQAMANPWLTPEQRQSVGVMMQQAQQANDPLRQMQVQQAQRELSQRDTQYVKGVGLIDAQTGEVIQQASNLGDTAEATEYGLTPQYITDAEGNLSMVQLGKDGSVNQVKLPEGAAVQKGVEKLDLGTTYQWYNTVTGEPIGQPIPKDNRGSARETAIGTEEGKSTAAAEASAPAEIAQADQGIALIDSIMNDPALPGITGMIQGQLPPLGQGGTDLNVKIQQLQGKAFLDAFESLKGGGAITEREGLAAQNAMARLDRAQSTEAYMAALNELKTIMQTGRQRAMGMVGGQTGNQTQSAAPPAQQQAPATQDAPPPGLSADDADLWKYATPEERKAIWGN